MSPVSILLAVVAVCGLEWCLGFVSRQWLKGCLPSCTLSQLTAATLIRSEESLRWVQISLRIIGSIVLVPVYITLAYLGLTGRSDFVYALAELVRLHPPIAELLCAGISGLLATVAFNRMVDQEHLCLKKDVNEFRLNLALFDAHVRSASTEILAYQQREQIEQAVKEGHIASWAVGVGLVGSCLGLVGTLVGLGIGGLIGRLTTSSSTED